MVLKFYSIFVGIGIFSRRIFVGIGIFLRKNFVGIGIITIFAAHIKKENGSGHYQHDW